MLRYFFPFSLLAGCVWCEELPLKELFLDLVYTDANKRETAPNYVGCSVMVRFVRLIPGSNRINQLMPLCHFS